MPWSKKGERERENPANLTPTSPKESLRGCKECSESQRTRVWKNERKLRNKKDRLGSVL